MSGKPSRLPWLFRCKVCRISSRQNHRSPEDVRLILESKPIHTESYRGIVPTRSNHHPPCHTKSGSLSTVFWLTYLVVRPTDTIRSIFATNIYHTMSLKEVSRIELRTPCYSPLREVAVRQQFITTNASRSLMLIIDIICPRIRLVLSGDDAEQLTIFVQPSRIMDDCQYLNQSVS